MPVRVVHLPVPSMFIVTFTWVSPVLRSTLEIRWNPSDSNAPFEASLLLVGPPKDVSAPASAERHLRNREPSATPHVR